MSMFAEQDNPFTTAMSRSVSMERACRILGVSRRTVYYWIKDGRLQTTRTPLGSQRVLTDSVRSLWIARA